MRSQVTMVQIMKIKFFWQVKWHAVTNVAREHFLSTFRIKQRGRVYHKNSYSRVPWNFGTYPQSYTAPYL